MLSVRIVMTDVYMSSPVKELDVTWSDFRGSEVRQVPVVRIFGPTLAGQKTCLHIHGLFPYLYVPYDGTHPADQHMKQFAVSLDKAVNIALGATTSRQQHVYKISLVNGIPYYGYHPCEKQFLKIYLYNPAMVKKVADLLLGGAVMSKSFQPHESHIPFTLQFFIDYNLHGMNLINLATIKFRMPNNEEGCQLTPEMSDFLNISSDTQFNRISEKKWTTSNIPSNLILSSERLSTCELEVDGVAADILNRFEINANLGTNPGLVALWEEERSRRRDLGDSSQLTQPDSQERTNVCSTDSEMLLKERLFQIMLPYKGNPEIRAVADHDSLTLQSSGSVEIHSSQKKDSPTDNLHDEVETFVNLTLIQNVVASSQSFQGSGSQRSSQNFVDTQDQALIDMMNSLADHASQDSHISSQMSNEDNDSILQSQGIILDNLEEDDVETLEMTQRVWDSFEEDNSLESDDLDGGNNSQGRTESDELPQITQATTDNTDLTSTAKDEGETEIVCESSDEECMGTDEPPQMGHTTTDNIEEFGSAANVLCDENETDILCESSDDESMGEAAVGFDIDGMDLSWDSSQLKDLPQFDGPADTKGKFTKIKRRLGTTGPLLRKDSSSQQKLSESCSPETVTDIKDMIHLKPAAVVVEKLTGVCSTSVQSRNSKFVSKTSGSYASSLVDEKGGTSTKAFHSTKDKSLAGNKAEVAGIDSGKLSDSSAENVCDAECIVFSGSSSDLFDSSDEDKGSNDSSSTGKLPESMFKQKCDRSELTMGTGEQDNAHLVMKNRRDLKTSSNVFPGVQNQKAFVRLKKIFPVQTMASEDLNAGRNSRSNRLVLKKTTSAVSMHNFTMKSKTEEGSKVKLLEDISDSLDDFKKNAHRSAKHYSQKKSSRKFKNILKVAKKPSEVPAEVAGFLESSSESDNAQAKGNDNSFTKTDNMRTNSSEVKSVSSGDSFNVPPSPCYEKSRRWSEKRLSNKVSGYEKEVFDVEEPMKEAKSEGALEIERTASSYGRRNTSVSIYSRDNARRLSLKKVGKRSLNETMSPGASKLLNDSSQLPKRMRGFSEGTCENANDGDESYKTPDSLKCSNNGKFICIDGVRISSSQLDNVDLFKIGNERLVVDKITDKCLLDIEHGASFCPDIVRNASYSSVPVVVCCGLGFGSPEQGPCVDIIDSRIASSPCEGNQEAQSNAGKTVGKNQREQTITHNLRQTRKRGRSSSTCDMETSFDEGDDYDNDCGYYIRKPCGENKQADVTESVGVQSNQNSLLYSDIHAYTDDLINDFKGDESHLDELLGEIYDFAARKQLKKKYKGSRSMKVKLVRLGPRNVVPSTCAEDNKRLNEVLVKQNEVTLPTEEIISPAKSSDYTDVMTKNLNESLDKQDEVTLPIEATTSLAKTSDCTEVMTKNLNECLNILQKISTKVVKTMSPTKVSSLSSKKGSRIKKISPRKKPLDFTSPQKMKDDKLISSAKIGSSQNQIVIDVDDHPLSYSTKMDEDTEACYVIEDYPSSPEENSESVLSVGERNQVTSPVSLFEELDQPFVKQICPSSQTPNSNLNSIVMEYDGDNGAFLANSEKAAIERQSLPKLVMGNSIPVTKLSDDTYSANADSKTAALEKQSLPTQTLENVLSVQSGHHMTELVQSDIESQNVIQQEHNESSPDLSQVDVQSPSSSAVSLTFRNQSTDLFPLLGEGKDADDYHDAMFNLSRLSPASPERPSSPPRATSPSLSETMEENVLGSPTMVMLDGYLKASCQNVFSSAATIRLDDSEQPPTAPSEVADKTTHDSSCPVTMFDTTQTDDRHASNQMKSESSALQMEDSNLFSFTEDTDSFVQNKECLVLNDVGLNVDGDIPANYHVNGNSLGTGSEATSQRCGPKLVFTPALPPPSYREVLDTLPEHDLPEVHHHPAFCSVPDDVPEKAMVVGGNILKVASNLISDIPEFDSQNNRLAFWQQRFMTQNMGSPNDSFCLATEMEQNPAIKASMLGDQKVIFTPCKAPPSRKEVQQWLQTKMDQRDNVIHKNNGNKEPSSQPGLLEAPGVHQENDGDECNVLDESYEAVEPTPKKQKIATRFSDVPPQHSTPMQSHKSSLDVDCTPILMTTSRFIPTQQLQTQTPGEQITLDDSIHVENPLSTKKQLTSELPASSEYTPLRKTLLGKKHFRTPVQEKEGSQIEGPTPNNTYGFKVSRQNVRDTKTLHEKQFLTVFSVEVHCTTRGDLKPDPEFDQICAIFYCIFDDSEKCDITGVIIMDAKSASDDSAAIASNKHRTLLQKSGVTGLDAIYVADETILIEKFVEVVLRFDPDILVGYEIQMSSWGYLLERSAHLDINLCTKLSRIPGEKLNSHFRKESDEWGSDYSSEIHIAGRVVINLWRIIRHEVALNIYTFENVYFHVLHQRVPLYRSRNLTHWYSNSSHIYRSRVILHYNIRARGNLEIMKKLDLIGQTSEFARIYGIEFYHVLSRGSQYRVESMMLRLAKPQNYIAVSPSPQQRSMMKAPECIALTLEPESRFYTDPVVVVDFQSLYPSIMIAYNYCFSTCLGRVESLAQLRDGPIKFGCTILDIEEELMKNLSLDDLNISPNGVVFVKQSVRKGVISSMVEEILNTRLMVKGTMKSYKKDKYLQQMLHSRQLGLKLIANVTYGYTSANFSGRMPCIEVADSIVRKARETLERAIKMVEETPRWGAKVVYGDTDSMFILMKGKTKDQAFQIGHEIADAVTADNPKPVKLKFEKVYLPCVLQTKKRYVGFMYETPDQKEPVYDAKGIETVRRDSCSAVAKILERTIKILFTTKDISQVKQYVLKQCQKVAEGRVSLQDLTFAKEYRGMPGYKPGACVPALEISRKLLSSDRRSEPRVGERVPYVIVYGTPGLPLIRLVRTPHEVLQDTTLRLNATYYITKQILPPLNRMFSLIGVNVFLWYNELPKVNKVQTAPSDVTVAGKKGTISQYFATKDCPICGTLTRDGVCAQCLSNPQLTVVVLNSKIRDWERTHMALTQICSSCSQICESQALCVSLDCPIMYRMNQALRNLKQVETLRNTEKLLHQF